MDEDKKLFDVNQSIEDLKKGILLKNEELQQLIKKSDKSELEFYCKLQK